MYYTEDFKSSVPPGVNLDKKVEFLQTNGKVSFASDWGGPGCQKCFSVILED